MSLFVTLALTGVIAFSAGYFVGMEDAKKTMNAEVEATRKFAETVMRMEAACGRALADCMGEPDK